MSDNWLRTARLRIRKGLAKRRERGVKTPELDSADEMITKGLEGKGTPGETKSRVQALESAHRERMKDLRKQGKGRKKGGRPSVLTVSGGGFDTNRRRH